MFWVCLKTVEQLIIPVQHWRHIAQTSFGIAYPIIWTDQINFIITKKSLNFQALRKRRFQPRPINVFKKVRPCVIDWVMESRHVWDGIQGTKWGGKVFKDQHHGKRLTLRKCNQLNRRSVQIGKGCKIGNKK